MRQPLQKRVGNIDGGAHFSVTLEFAGYCLSLKEELMHTHCGVAILGLGNSWDLGCGSWRGQEYGERRDVIRV